jgi:hypothetical protein
MYGRLHDSVDGYSGYSNQVFAYGGDRVDYIISASIAAIGTSNSHGYTITSGTLADGINSFTIDLFDPIGNPIQVNFDTPASFVGDWGSGSGASGGTPVPRASFPIDDDLIGIHPARPSGLFSISTTQLMGSFVVSQSGSTGGFGARMRWSPGGTGLIRINGATTTIPIDSISESSSDPLVTYHEMTIGGVLPEPGGVLTLAGMMWVLGYRARRRGARGF